MEDQLNQIKEIAGSYGAFAALRDDGTVITWGDANYGGAAWYHWYQKVGWGWLNIESLESDKAHQVQVRITQLGERLYGMRRIWYMFFQRAACEFIHPIPAVVIPNAGACQRTARLCSPWSLTCTEPAAEHCSNTADKLCCQSSPCFSWER